MQLYVWHYLPQGVLSFHRKCHLLVTLLLLPISELTAQRREAPIGPRSSVTSEDIAEVCQSSAIVQAALLPHPSIKQVGAMYSLLTISNQRPGVTIMFFLIQHRPTNAQARRAGLAPACKASYGLLSQLFRGTCGVIASPD